MTVRPPPTPTALDPRTISDADAALLADHLNAVRAEYLPHDPPRPADAIGRNLRSFRRIEHLDVRLWTLREEGRIVADLLTEVSRRPENPHLLEFTLQVRPDARRRGLARPLLAELLGLARREERRLLMTWVHGGTPGNDAMRHLGAQAGLTMVETELRLADVDRALLRTWCRAERGRAGGYELLHFDDPYPEALMAPMADLIDVMNTAPRGELDMEDFKATPEQLRAWRQRDRERGVVRWASVARHIPSDRLVGYTEIVWDPSEPHVVQQSGTGVRPEDRGHGLGKWLKAAMLERVFEGRPEARVVRTGNADSNASMLAINRGLGFAPYLEATIWQLPTDRLAEYLAEREA